MGHLVQPCERQSAPDDLRLQFGFQPPLVADWIVPVTHQPIVTESLWLSPVVSSVSPATFVNTTAPGPSAVIRSESRDDPEGVSSGVDETVLPPHRLRLDAFEIAQYLPEITE